MSFHFEHDLHDLASDLLAMPKTVKVGGARAVKKNVALGTKLARENAKRASGPHGKAYFKRISGEQTGILTGEFGPSGVVEGNAVGGGWRHGDGNIDLLKAADVVAFRFGEDVDKLVDGLFW